MQPSFFKKQRKKSLHPITFRAKILKVITGGPLGAKGTMNVLEGRRN